MDRQLSNPTSDIPPRELEMKISAPFTIAAVGDLISPQPIARQDPQFTDLVAHLRAADVGFANMESSIVEKNEFPGAIGGTVAPPAIGDAIKAMGVTMVSRANNHTFDGGAWGMIETDRALDRLGITHAGTGMNLQEARAAAYRETPKGRVGLVSIYSLADTGHFGPTYARTEATYQTGSMGGAPGINPLHLTAHNVVSQHHLDQLKAIALASYGDRPGAVLAAGEGRGERFRFYDQWYEAGENIGAIRYQMDELDHQDILASVSNGKIYSDFLIATIHSHQATRFAADCWFPGGPKGLKEPIEHDAPDFLVQLAHDCVDRGADMFVSHGVHALAGVEVYRGKPIFYGLSNFIFQFGLQVGPTYDVLSNFRKKSELAHPACHEAVLVTSHFDNGELHEVRLYPADLGGASRPISQMGIPLTPSSETADRILRDVQSYSDRFGTQIAIEDGVGIIRL